jgi:hypothetical protein
MQALGFAKNLFTLMRYGLAHVDRTVIHPSIKPTRVGCL